MKNLLLTLCLLASVAGAQAQTPSKASLDRLITVMGTQKIVDTMYAQLDRTLRTGLEQNINNNPNLQQADRERALKNLDGFVKKMMGIYREEMSWPKLREMYAEIYAESFTQQEVDGLISFYESPTGKAFVAKMPIVTQKSMGQVQQRMNPLMQRIQAAAREFAQEFEKGK